MNSDENIQEVYARTSIDANLFFLVNTVNRFDFEMGVTILVKGIVITGLLISGQKYHREMAQGIAKAGTVGEALAGYFRDTAENMYAPSKNEEGEYNDTPCNYIHLKDISMQGGGGGFNKLNNAFLRVSLEEVDGHIIGNVS
ncbi:gas vesicle protein [Serratia fonticola]|uniref:Gas vesicle protein n=1 Tax=Serratia fonticola TaxID=47917 RepID=A0ABY9PL57_SERFO|nr:gas vesicle protein [Serratia fonticola]WMT13365.1 gas vesicle protein [Serratia fonticola]